MKNSFQIRNVATIDYSQVITQKITCSKSVLQINSLQISA